MKEIDKETLNTRILHQPHFVPVQTHSKSRDALAPEASKPNYNVSIFSLNVVGEISIRPPAQILVTALDIRVSWSIYWVSMHFLTDWRFLQETGAARCVCEQRFLRTYFPVTLMTLDTEGRKKEREKRRAD